MNLFFWLGTKVLSYVRFTYFNMLSKDPSGSFTKICDVTLPRLLRVRRPWYLNTYCTSLIYPIAFPYFQTDWTGKVRLLEKNRIVSQYDRTVKKACFNPRKWDRYYLSKKTSRWKFQACRWSDSCQNNSDALSIFYSDARFVWISFCRWRRFIVFWTNPWNWKFQNRLKCLYVGGYSKLRVMVIFLSNMGLLIVNTLFLFVS